MTLGSFFELQGNGLGILKFGETNCFHHKGIASVTERNMSVLVDIRDVSKIYNPGENEVRALDHVTVSIEEGEYVAIIGQSGSGKSTLMNILGCLDVPTEGTYFLHGNNVMELDDDELSDIRNQEIGFIFQGFNLIANLTAFENVELPLIYRGVGKESGRNWQRVLWRRWGWEIVWTTGRQKCPADSNSELPSQGQSHRRLPSFWRMSRPEIWIPIPPGRSWTFSKPCIRMAEP